MSDGLSTRPNPLLQVVKDNKPNWNLPDQRRHGFHNLHRIARYSLSFRAHNVLTLEKRMDLAIADLEAVRRLTTLPWFSAMVILKGQEVLYEKYAPDFGPDREHAIQSISKTTMNLLVGLLVEQGRLDLTQTINHYLPEMGSGYGPATVQQVLNMDVVNDYSEDYHDNSSTVFRHEEAMGSRLPADPANEMTMRSFLPTISSPDITNHSGKAVYKSANTEVLAMLVERVSGRPLRAWLADICDAAGLEGALNITCDREGFPTMDGGICVTARDLARYGSLFVRRGLGVNGEKIGSKAFIEGTLSAGIPMPAPRDWLRYSNQTNTNGRWLGHGGYGGQYMLADLTSGIVGVFFSVLEDQDAYDSNYYVPIIRTLEAIAAR